MLIILGGLPGAGKTTIARGLSRELGGVHVRIDSIEQAIIASGVVRGSIDDAGYRAAYAVAGDNLGLGRIVIADSVNPLPITRSAWRAVAERLNVRAIDVEIVCSDAVEHRRRVETRMPDIDGHQLPTWTEVVERDYVARDDARLVIDTALMTPSECVRSIQDAVRQAAA